MAERPGNLVVRRVGAAETRPLRQRVLRPHQEVDEVRFPGDDDRGSVHLAAVAPGGSVVCVCSLIPQPAPWAPSAPAWRLRGMATAPDWRARGVGASVLAEAVDHVARHGGGLLWCNARLPAVGFYEGAGFVTRGEEWEEPDIGPHVAMYLSVEPAR